MAGKGEAKIRQIQAMSANNVFEASIISGQNSNKCFSQNWLSQ